jgi:hypothetical protein
MSMLKVPQDSGIFLRKLFLVRREYAAPTWRSVSRWPTSAFGSIDGIDVIRLTGSASPLISIPNRRLTAQCLVSNLGKTQICIETCAPSLEIMQKIGNPA